MAPACILLPALGPAELLPADTCARDVLGPGPLLRAAAAGSRGAAVAWANPHAHAEHNEPASRIAGQAVRGDACLLLQEASPSDVQQLLAGRPPRRAAATAAAPAAAPAAAAVAPCKRPHLEPDPAAAAADAGGEPAARGCGDVADSARWQDLPAHVISAVALKAGGTVAGAMPVYGTCRSWQASILEDDQLLRDLRFSLDARAPFRGDHRLPAAALRGYLKAVQRYPRLLQRAAQLNNLGAVLAMARLLDAAASGADAIRFWRRAAKLGAVEAQLRVGLAAYHGSCGVAQDPEGAAMWLGKALRQVQAPAPAAAVASRPPAPRAAAPAAAAPAAAITDAAGCAVDAAARARVLREAGLVLGYLHFDGEGVAKDAQAACALFRAAADAGCHEAGKTLGWIYNTGQYE